MRSPCIGRALMLAGVLLGSSAWGAAVHASASDVADYVIVGAGPAGLVLADELTKDGKTTVVLLEAGPAGDANVEVSTPAIFFEATYSYIWPYLSEADANLGGAEPNLVQGKMVGGGTGINAMLYCRGSASVFDEWAAVSGNAGLGWAGMLEAFRATSHWTDEASITYEQPLNTSAFGSGPLEVSRQRQLFPLDVPFVDALGDAFGLAADDFVSGGGIGVSQAVNSIVAANRTRSYAHNAFGYAAAGRANFRLVTGAWVAKIGFSADRRAESVTYNDTATGTMHTLAAREVIVTAGALNAPQLLMLSGIGPAHLLRTLGIHVVQELAGVGQRLLDHHMAILEYVATAAEPTAWQDEYNASFAAAAAAAYAADGAGWLGAQCGDAFGASRLPASFLASSSAHFRDLAADRPHLAWGYSNQAMMVDLTNSAPNVSTVSAYVSLVQPESHGNVSLASADYRDAPLVYSNYWGTAAEQAAILYAYKQLRAVMNSSAAMAPYIASELFPGANVTSDADLWAAIQQSSSSWHHPVGTTPLGTVLDADWRVKGVKGLRVVGSSAAPQIPTCPIQASIYALAYVAAQDIKKADGL